MGAVHDRTIISIIYFQRTASILQLPSRALLQLFGQVNHLRYQGLDHISADMFKSSQVKSSQVR